MLRRRSGQARRGGQASAAALRRAVAGSRRIVDGDPGGGLRAGDRSGAGRLAGWVVVCSNLLAAGCERPPPVPQFEVLNGRVVAVQPASGEISLAVRDAGRESEGRERIELCIVTRDAEVYADDRLCALDALTAGDRLEVVGWRDPNPRLGRFMVVYAFVGREASPASAVPGASEPPGP